MQPDVRTCQLPPPCCCKLRLVNAAPNVLTRNMEVYKSIATICKSIAIVHRDWMAAVCKLLSFASVIPAVSPSMVVSLSLTNKPWDLAADSPVSTAVASRTFSICCSSSWVALSSSVIYKALEVTKRKTQLLCSHLFYSGLLLHIWRMLSVTNLSADDDWSIQSKHY